jgi:hypothetical protein
MIKIDRNMLKLWQFVCKIYNLNIGASIGYMVLTFINVQQLISLTISWLYARTATCFDRNRSSGYQKCLKNKQGKSKIRMEWTNM